MHVTLMSMEGGRTFCTIQNSLQLHYSLNANKAVCVLVSASYVGFQSNGIENAMIVSTFPKFLGTP